MRNRLQFGGYQRQRLVRSLAAGLVTAACGLALVLTPLGTTFERTFGLDWLFKMRGARPPPPDVAVVGINSGTGRALDLPRLPHDWSRTIHAQLIKRLVDQNAEGIVFDMDFNRPKPGDEDAILARAMADADRVVLFEWLAARRAHVITAGREGWRVDLGRAKTAAHRDFRSGCQGARPVPAAQAGPGGVRILGVQIEHRRCADHSGRRSAIEGVTCLRPVARRSQGRAGDRSRAPPGACRGGEGAA